MSSGVGWLSGPSSAAVRTRWTPRCARARAVSIDWMPARACRPRIHDRGVDAVDVDRILHHAVADAIASARARLVAEQDDLRRVELDARRAGGDRGVQIQVLADLLGLRHRELAEGDRDAERA